MARIKENLIDDIGSRIEKQYGALAVKHMDADAYEELFQAELISVMEGNTELVPPAETTCYISCGGARSISYGSEYATYHCTADIYPGDSYVTCASDRHNDPVDSLWIDVVARNEAEARLLALEEAKRRAKASPPCPDCGAVWEVPESSDRNIAPALVLYVEKYDPAQT